MPRLLESRSGYYFVDDWKHVKTLQTAVSRIMSDSYKGGDMWLPVKESSWRVREAEERGEFDGFICLGAEDEETETLYIRRVYWAKSDHYRYVPKETK